MILRVNHMMHTLLSTTIRNATHTRRSRVLHPLPAKKETFVRWT